MSINIAEMLTIAKPIADIKRSARLMSTTKRPPSVPGPPLMTYMLNPDSYNFGGLTLQQSYLFTIGADYMLHVFIPKAGQSPYAILTEFFGTPASSDDVNHRYTWHLGANDLVAITDNNDFLRLNIFTPAIVSQGWAGIN